jgi:hypothetical protein
MGELKGTKELFAGRHFDREIIVLCVRWYLRYKLSLRDLVEMMASRSTARYRQTQRPRTGLAQEFAYSVLNVPGVPRVTKVYAFDPSAGTGYYSVESGLRDSNKQSLAIDRNYQRREILAILRSFMNLIHRPSAQAPLRQGGSLCPVYGMEPGASAFHQ